MPACPCDSVVLAIGHRPPADPLGDRWSGPRRRLVADPWQPFAFNGIGPHEPVAILGSGLTAIDAVLSLARPDRTAPIHLLSRRGLLPKPHSRTPPPAADLGGWVEALVARHGPR